MDYTIYSKDRTSFNKGDPLDHWASDLERFGQLEKGDRVFVVSWSDRKLWLFGHFTVDAVVTRAEAEQRLHTTNLWQARYHAIAAEPFQPLVQRDITDLIPEITFISRKRPHVDPDGDPQQVRGFRKITASTAALLARK